MTQQAEPSIWDKKNSPAFLERRKTTHHLGKNITNNPIKWPNRLNPAFGLKKIAQHFSSAEKLPITWIKTLQTTQ